MVAPIIRNLKPKLNIKAIKVTVKGLFQEIQRFGVCSLIVQKKTFSGFDLINFLYFVSLLYFRVLT